MVAPSRRDLRHRRLGKLAIGGDLAAKDGLEGAGCLIQDIRGRRRCRAGTVIGCGRTPEKRQTATGQGGEILRREIEKIVRFLIGADSKRRLGSGWRK